MEGFIEGFISYLAVERGLANNTLIINLPGSPRAVQEILEYLGPVLEHAVYMVKGENVH